jgi:hypothetical protein
MSIYPAMILFLTGAVFAQQQPSTTDSSQTGYASVRSCSGSDPSTSAASCNDPVADISIAKSSELYSTMNQSIVLLGKDKYGFPADVAGAALGLAHAQWSFSLSPWKFRKLRFVDELQMAKRYGPPSVPLPTLVAVDVPGAGLQIYPAEFIRSLFETPVFPSTLRVIESPTKDPPRKDKALYIVLDPVNAKAAMGNFKDTSKAATAPGASQKQSVRKAVSSLDPRPRLEAISYAPSRAGEPAAEDKGSPASDQRAGVSWNLSTWLQSVTIRDVSVGLFIHDNHWRCDTWEHVVYFRSKGTIGIPEQMTNELKAPPFNDEKKGCVLDLEARIPEGVESVFKSASVVAILGDPFMCGPKDFGDPPENGVHPGYCGNGASRWKIDTNPGSSAEHQAERTEQFQIAVPLFDIHAAPPNIIVGLGGTVKSSGSDVVRKSCWCWRLGQSQCSPPDQQKCEAEIR